MGSKKKKKRCKQITSRSPRTMSGLVRQPDNCPIGLIIFFFFFARSRFLAHNAYQPLFKKKKKKKRKRGGNTGFVWSYFLTHTLLHVLQLLTPLPPFEQMSIIQPRIKPPVCG
jgi:hypothetical protein